MRTNPAVQTAGAIAALVASLFASAPATSQQARPAEVRSEAPLEHRVFAGRSYDPALPAPSAFLGYELGQHIATYAAMIPYLERLADLSDRMLLHTHGETYEGRRIYHATISSPENLARLDEIRANLAHLADPRTLSSARQAEAIFRNTPAVVMLVFGTDGAETAGPEAAMQVAYQLAAATDSETRELLRDLVVVVVPASNPDSNQRVVAWYNAFRVGPAGTADPDAAEHQRPWGLNSNNRYQIDLNRESVWGVQRETRAMVDLYRAWNPQVFVDNHGEHASYTGPWYVEPMHEQLTARQRDWLRTFGTAMAGAFSQHGYRYTPWDFGQFDPGYWDTYPNFTGAIAWTTETTGGGTRGLRLEPAGGPLYTLEDGIIQHMIASDVTLRVAAGHRERLLHDFHTYKRTAIEEGSRGPVRAYALSAANDAHRLATVVNTLRRNGIEVHRTTAALRSTRAWPFFRASGDDRRAGDAVDLPAGSYVVALAQPQSRLARVLLEPEARFSDDFLAQIEQARAAGDGSAARMFYDITAWSMPLTFHLDAYELAEAIPTAALSLVMEDVRPRGQVIHPTASYAFLIDYGSNGAIHALAALRRNGIRFRVATTPLRAGGQPFRSGAVVILQGENPGADLGALATDLAATAGVKIVGVDGPLIDQCPDLGSGALAPVMSGRIGVIMDTPVSPTSYGHIWYTFERIYGIAFTALNFSRLPAVDLTKYDVLILPDGRYGAAHAAVAADVAGRLRDWVEAGGTLIGIRAGSAWIAREEFGITAARLRVAEEGLPAIPGAILRARITSPGHPLAFGYADEELPVMVWSRLAFDPGTPGDTPIRIVQADRARVSGFAFPESIERVADTPYVVRDRRGRGAVVLFLDDPIFRLFWDGLTRMFFNAVFLGQS